MGCVKTIKHDEFPEQGKSLGRRVSTCYHYDFGNRIGGKIVRDDMESPYETLILLDNGRIIRAVECHYSFE
jgi:hypothetical protein